MKICVLLFILVLLNVCSAHAQTSSNTVAPALTQNPAAADTSQTDAVKADPSKTDASPAEKVRAAPDDATLTAAAPAALKRTTTTIIVPPEKRQPIRMTRFEVAPVIDGVLDETVWKQAAVLKDFYQFRPGDNTPPTRPTEVLLGYDAKNFYIGFRATEEPGKVRATVARRDQIFNDDNVAILLDTFNDQRRAYLLAFNPLGIQADGIFTEADDDTDLSVDIVMDSKGVVIETGYTIEVAVPFKSLRYEAGKGKFWGINVVRESYRANNEQDSWMPISRDQSGFLIKSGRLTGLEGIETTRQLEIVPSLTLSETGRRVRSLPPRISPNDPLVPDPGRFVNSPIGLDPGLTAKFGLTPTITLDLALNPDFAQVEADQTVVTANQRFPIFFEERRSFFLEGIDIFRTQLDALNTRAIIDPDYAAKLSGKRGRNSFGLLVASDNAPGNYSQDERTDPARLPSINKFLDKNAYIGVLRLKRDVGRENNIGMIATTYNFIERRNQLGGFDARFRVNPTTIFDFQMLGTTSRRFFRDPDLGEDIYRTGNGFGYSATLDKTGRNFGYIFSGEGRTRDYRADVGFTRRTNTNREFFAVRFSNDPNPQRRIISYRYTHSARTSFDWQRRAQNWESEAQLTLNLRRQTSVGFGFEGGYDRVFEEEFGDKRKPGRPGAFAGNDSERSAGRRTVFAFLESNWSKKYSGFVNVGYTHGELDFDFGNGRRYPRVSLAALADPTNPDVPLDPGPGNSLNIRGRLAYQPTDLLRLQLNYTKSRLARQDTRRLAFDDNIFALRSTYQFTRFTFARLRLDYSTLSARVRGQALLGWTPNPGTSFYLGYNDDLNRNGYSPFTDNLEPGFRRNGRTFFIKMAYLFQRSL